MRNPLLFILIASALIFSRSCETTEKIDDFPLRPSQLVLNCLFTSDSTWNIQVSYSLSVLDNAPLEMIEDAEIELYKNGELVDHVTTPGIDGFYHSDSLLPFEGETYSVKVTAPGYEKEVFAQDYLPERVSLKSLSSTLIDSSFHIWNDYYTDLPVETGHVEGFIDLTISDPPGVSNYYNLQVYMLERRLLDREDSTSWYYRRKPVNYSVTDATTEVTSMRGGALLTDQYFDGMEHKMKIRYNEWDDKPVIDTFYVELISLTEAGFLYRRSIEDYQDAKGDPFSEPVLVYSNIENGFGIFAGYSSYTGVVQILE